MGMSNPVPAGANRLIRETSPYLRQHAHNPVDWYPWGPEAFDAARQRDVPILLSVGYSACHWCHVMERESFEDADTAGLMNARFVCVKVDREERPDVDAIYMHATQAMSGSGGWPMTVFLTPGGRPFYAGTYFPPEPRYGMPSFQQVLEGVAEAWEHRRGTIETQAESVARDLRTALQRVTPPEMLNEGIASQAVAGMERRFDRAHGGFGGAPKFPQPMLIEFLLRHADRTGHDAARAMALQTLDAMAAGGIRDHVGGGFHRYSVDAEWLVPHFEKMLYDNAQLATAYWRAYRATSQLRHRAVAEQILDYVRTQMTLPSGGFMSAQDADSDGEEGLYYTWTPDEVGAALGDDASEACAALGISPTGHLDGRSVVHRRADADDDSRVRSWLGALAEARRHRTPPATDGKVIASWNGMMLSAFAEAAMLTGRADYLQTAVNSGEFLLREMCSEDADGRLRLAHSGIELPNPNPHHPTSEERIFRVAPIGGFLDDYALVASGMLDLSQATGNTRWSVAAKRLTDAMLEAFASDGPLLHAVPPTECELFANPFPTEDNAVPSGNAVAAELWLRMAHFTEDTRYENSALASMRSMAADMARHPMAFGRWLCALEDWLGRRIAVVIAGGRDDPRYEELQETAHRRYGPDMLIVRNSESPDDPAIAAGRAPVGGVPVAYVCVGTSCLAPIRDAAQLAAALDEVRSR